MANGSALAAGRGTDAACQLQRGFSRPEPHSTLRAPRRPFEQFGLDPCGNDPEGHQRPNCAANGVPGGAYVQDGLGAIEVIGGNPELEPETGHTLGVGLVYTPFWAEGLSASVDYFQANRSNHISVSYAEEIMFECAEHGASSMCDVDYQSSGRPCHSGGELLPQLRGVRKSARYDFAINWSAVTRIGELEFESARHLSRSLGQATVSGRLDCIHTRANSMRAPARAGARRDTSTGTPALGWPAMPPNISAATRNWSNHGRVSTSSSSLFIAASTRSCITTLKAGYRFDSGVTVRAAITNVTDEDPPYLNLAPANTDVATYRLLGRSYFLELRYQVQ